MTLSINGTTGLTFPDTSLQNTSATAFKTQNIASTGGTLTASDKAAFVSVTGGVTIPASVFIALDTLSIYNASNTTTITITQGSGLNLLFAGTSTNGNRSLAQNGLATVIFTSPTTAVISGGGLS